MGRRLDVRIERATEAHAAAIAPRIDLSGYSRRNYSASDLERRAVARVRASIEAWCWLDGSRPVAIAGVIPVSIMGSVVSAWLLATPEAFTNTRAFWLASKAVVAHLSHEYHRIEGRVDVEFTKSIVWLRRLGFTVLDVRVPLDGHVFLPFEKER